MSEESAITNDKQVSRYLMATNAEEMRHRIESGLRRSAGRDLSVKELDVPRVFLRENESFCIQYSLVVQSGKNARPERMTLCGAQLKTAAEATNIATNWGRELIFCEDLNLVIPIFPSDPVLSIVGQLGESDRIPAFLNSWLSGQLSDGEVASEFSTDLLGYRLEKRCTLSCSVKVDNKDASKSRTIKAVAKILPPKKAAKLAKRLVHVHQHWNSVNETKGMTTPKTYELDTSTGLYLMEYLPGQSLHDLLGKDAFVPACKAAGKLLRKLHSIPEFSGSVKTREKEVEDLGKRINLVSLVREECRESLITALDMLKSSDIDTVSSFEQTCLHGDFYDKQVLYGTDRASLIDFDSLTGGDPAVDVGNFLAHLDLRNLQHPNEVQLIIRGREVFLDTYCEGEEDFENRINWWKSAALVRLATIYALRPRWQHLPPKLLANATDLCGGIIQKQRKAETQ